MFSNSLFGQITANGNTGASTTNYTNGTANDPLYIWSTNIIGSTNGSLTATPPSGTGPFTFEWYYHDAPTSTWLSYASDAGATSTISNLPSDGYRVEIYDSGANLVGCYTAWVWNMNIDANNSNTPTACDATDITGTVDAESAFTYYNPPPPESIISASTEINICFSATHTWVSDLAFYLVGPPSCGSPVILLSPNPEVLNPANSICNSADDVSNLCFSSTSANTIDVCAEAGPLSGTFGAYGNGGSSTPIDWSPLYGCNAATGGWSVQIYDCIGGDTGALTNADLTFSNLTSFCGSPTVINYNSGAINSAIDDNSCDAGSASIFQVPLPPDLTTPININANVSYVWTTDNGVVVPNPTTSLSSSITGINDSTNFILTATIDYNGVSNDDDDTTTFLNTCCDVLTSAGSDVEICSGDSELLGDPAIAGYSYSWSPTAGLDDPNIAQPTVTLTNVTSGQVTTTYTLTATNVTDGGCSEDYTVDVTVNPQGDPTFSVSDFCPGEANSATIDGTSGGTFSFNPTVTDGATVDPSTGEITNGVSGTTYTIEYTFGSASCEVSSTENVTVNPVLDASFSLTNFCEGSANSANITGDTGGTFAFNPAVSDGATVDASTGEITDGVGGTTYTLEYTVGTGGCQDITTQNVTVVLANDASFSLTDYCEGTTNSANIIGDAGGTFTFNPGVSDGATVDANTGEITGGIGGTTYTIEYTVGTGGCQDITTQNVTVIASDDASFSLTDFCFGTANSATVTGDAGGTFSFNPAVTDGATINATTGEITNGVAGTTYSVDYSTVGTCPATSNESVDVFELPNVEAGSNQTICEGDNITLTGSISGTGALPITYNWDNGITDGQSFTPPTGTTIYTVTAIDNNGCENSATVQIETLPVPQSIFSGNPITGFVPLDVDFTNTSIDANNFVWDFGNGENNTVSDLSDQSTTYTDAGTYIVSLTASNGICSYESTIEVIVSELAPSITIPNVFTPNGDFVNDVWEVQTEHIESIEIFIVNRWGNTVATITDLDGYWDGTISNRPAAGGVYFYKYTAKALNGEETTGQGHLTLKRD